MDTVLQELFLTIVHAIDRHGHMPDTKNQPLAATIAADMWKQFKCEKRQ
jgi:hypothetical protein